MANKIFVIVYSNNAPGFEWTCTAASSISEAKKLAFHAYTDCQHLIDIFETGGRPFQEVALKVTQIVSTWRTGQ